MSDPGGGAAGGSVQETDEPFFVADFGPMDELPKEIKKPAIYAVFSQPVVPLAKLGDPIRESAGLFTVEPPLTGVYRWYGTKLLSFEPDAEYIPQQRYTITVSEKIKSLGGKSLQGERSFSFETERLSVIDWRLGEDEDRWVSGYNAHPEDAKHIRLIFSHPVNLNEIAKWIEIRAAGRMWPFTLSRPVKIDNIYSAEQGVLLSIRDTLPMDTDVEMELKTGARSEQNWLGTKQAQTWSYHTLLPFMFEDVSVRSWSRPRTEEGDSIPVSLDFNQDVEPEGAERYFSVEGFPPLNRENVHVYGSRVVINRLPLEYQKIYYVRISASLKDLYGRSLGKGERLEVKTGEANSYVYIQNQGSRMLEAGYPPKIVWEAQNPVSVNSAITAAGSPYEMIPPSNLTRMNISELPANSKRYFFEDLSPFLNQAGKGSAALRWNYQTKSSWDAKIYSSNAWLTVQVTNIGITVRYAYNTVLVWATHLSDGTPAVNAAVELLENENVVVSGRTDAQGLAVFNFTDGNFVSVFTQPQSYYNGDNTAGRGFRVRVIEGQGNTMDRAEFIPNDSHNLWRFNIEAAASPFTVEQEKPVIFLFTDRGLYRPGETVTFRGIDRSLIRGIYEAFQGPYKIEVSTGGYRAPVIISLDGVSTVNGGSYGSFTLPEKLDPGQYQIIYRRNIKSGVTSGREIQTSISFTVANFERLRFESSVRFPDLTHYRGDKLGASLSASWLSGGGISGAPYTWFMTREPTWFSPDGGIWRNWRFGPELNDSRSYIGQGEGSLGPDGKATISAESGSDGVEGAPYSYRIETSVQDAARQEIASRASVTVHPASFYIAARLDSGTLRNAANAGGGGTGGFPPFAASSPSAYFLSAEKGAVLSWALVSPEGGAWQPPAAGELSIQLVRYEWKQAKQAGIGGRVNLTWERVEETEEERIVKIDAAGRNSSAGTFVSGIFNFTPAKSGLWEVRIQGKDQKERIAATRFRFYVSGAGWVRWGSDDVDTISLATDRDSYAPGETAKILVRSPLEKGKYLLTLEREGIISQKIIELEGSALTIDIPVQESYLPIVYAVISSYTVRSGPPQNTYYEPDLDKPKGIFGVTPIYVSNESRNYQIEIENSKGAYRPAEEAEVRLKVSLNGKPAPATEISFMAVDRGVVDLINYHVPDPVRFFYDPRNFPLGVRGADSRSLLIDPVTYSLSDLQGGDTEEDSGKIEERKDFRPTAIFEPYLLTGPDGTVTVKFKLPDSLTTYRCTAVAAGLHNFGIREHDLRVSAPLTATAALPRKLRWRDTGTVSLILTNLENNTVEARVSLAAAVTPNVKSLWDTIVEVDGEASKTVSVLPGTSAEVRFRVAALGAGEAQLTFTLQSPSVNERIIKTILVDRPILTETVTTIGNLNSGDSFIEEGFILPSLVPEGTGNVAVSLSSSRLAALKEAVRYLLDYPYGCLEQRTARLLPIVAFGEYLAAFDLDSPLNSALNSNVNIQKLVENELAELAKSQTGEGSFPYWPGGMRGDIFVSLRMAHIAALAKAKGWNVPLNTQRLLSYITNVTGDTGHFAYNDPFIKGYSLWIRALYAERIGAEISNYLKRGDEPGISGWAFAGLAAMELKQRDIASSCRDRIRRYIRPGTRSLDLTDTYVRQSGYWGFDADRYALALMLFSSLDSGDDMTTRLANSLIERQRRGVWSNTVSSFWAILAFGMIGDSESSEWKSANAPLNAKVSLGGASLLDAEFKTYGGVPVSYNGLFSEQPLADLSRDTLLPLRIERGGPGRLFYTASLRYGIPAELAGAHDEGLCVYVEIYDSDGVQVKNSRLRAGKTYTRKIVLSSSRDRTFVALRVPIPSGAEIIDSTFVTSSTAPPREGDPSSDNAERNGWGWWNSPPTQFIMDDEARYHWDFLRAGKQEIEFRFRAVMPGVYPTPPASAECMYEEEIFGRSAGELVRIE
ncbi:MAG: alpha-2-macroglobulin [Treponema sp.]|nr:alpha-2-macroglobulin [Treponema sp.]